MPASNTLHFGLDVSDQGIFSADDLMQLQGDENGAWLLSSSSSDSCSLCTETCHSATAK